MVLDASVLIAHFSRTDAHHSTATAILVEAGPESLLVHPMTMAEVLVGGVRAGRVSLMRDALRAADVEVAPSDVDEPLRLAELRVGTGLQLPDCCVLDVAINHQCSLATFDAALGSAARQRGVAVLPEET
jgi:predicted nucleic acid-binding protein